MSHCRSARSVLHCSSTAVYAPNGGAPMHEDDPLGRDHHQDLMPTYSTAKTAAESVVRFAAREFDLPTTIARLCVPYGDDGGWPLFHLLMAMGGTPIPVHPDGSRYNPIHHDDIVRQIPALMDAATTPPTIVNWASDETVSVREWTGFLAEIAGVEPTFEETDTTVPSACVNTQRLGSFAPACEVGWRDGFERLTVHAFA